MVNGTLTRGVARMAGIVCVAAAFMVGPGRADDSQSVEITLKDHKFTPAEPAATAGKPIVVTVTNEDATPAEFESKPLRIEKAVPAGGKITVQVRPLTAGRYKFFDDYHEDSAVGFLVIQ